jgi:hypothetical protein
MNNAVIEFVRKHQDKLTGNVIDVGGMDVNGSLKKYWPHFLVVDMREGKGVDVVCKAEDLSTRFGKGSFDGLVSCETLEHMEDWRGCVRGMWDVVKENGWLVMTIAAMTKGRHNYPNDYWRCRAEDIYDIFPNPDDVGHFGVSLGWVVQKRGDLPDLSKINMIPVDSVKV